MRSCLSNSPTLPTSLTELRQLVADEVSEQIRRFNNRKRLVFYNIPDRDDHVTRTYVERILNLQIDIPYDLKYGFSIIRRMGEENKNKPRPLLVELHQLPMPNLKELALKLNDPSQHREYIAKGITVRRMETQPQRKEGYLFRQKRRQEQAKVPKELTQKASITIDEEFKVQSQTTHEPISIPVCKEFYEKNKNAPQAEFCMENGFLHPALIEGTAEYNSLQNHKRPLQWPEKPFVNASNEELESWENLARERQIQWNDRRIEPEYSRIAYELMRNSVQYYYDNNNFHQSKLPYFVNDWKKNDDKL